MASLTIELPDDWSASTGADLDTVARTSPRKHTESVRDLVGD